MHFDGKIPWHTAETLALAGVLRQADSRPGKGEAEPIPESSKGEEPIPAVQTGLFSLAKGPYSSIEGL
jgi:hypothetical protein